MTLSLLLSIVFTFILVFAMVWMHTTYIRTREFYNVKLVTMHNKDVELSRVINELVDISRENKRKYSEERNICGIDGTKECTLCDDKCLFKKEANK